VRDVMKSFNPDVSVLHKENRGVAIGYNTGMVLARGDYIVITGCDMLMPANWLATFKEYVTRIPETGVACMYSGPLSWVPERIRGEEAILRGLRVRPAMPIGRRIFKRELIKHIGYFHEGFGLYGYDDLHWGYRAERVCKELGLIYYVIPDQIAEHLGTEGVHAFDQKDESSYHKFKQEEVAMDYKQKLLQSLQLQGWPKFSPYP